MGLKESKVIEKEVIGDFELEVEINDDEYISIDEVEDELYMKIDEPNLAKMGYSIMHIHGWAHDMIHYINHDPDTLSTNGAYTDYLYLLDDGTVQVGNGTEMTQEMFVAITNEMKQRGWWK